MTQWEPKEFNRRSYSIQPEKGELDDARIEVVLKINGKTYAHLQLREPGLVALVSRPDDEGIDVEIVGPGGVRFTDLRLPSGESTPDLSQWQKDALFAAKEMK